MRYLLIVTLGVELASSDGVYGRNMALGPEGREVAQEDIDAITSVALDYLEGYVSGDAQRHARSYHPEAIKRRYTQDDDGVFGIVTLSPQTMTDYAATETGDETDGHVEVLIDDVSQDIASVRVYSRRWLTSSM